MTAKVLSAMLQTFRPDTEVKLIIFPNDLVKNRLFALYDLTAVRLLTTQQGTTEVVGITHRKHS